MAVVTPRNMLEEDKGDNLKFGTNPRNSLRKSHVGFLSLITLLVFFLSFMAPWTSVNHSAVFQRTDRIHSKTHLACRIYAVSPSPLLPFFPCYFFDIRKPNANSELRIETFHSLIMSPAFPWFVKCLAYHQSSTDLVDIFCQSLHFKVGKQRVLKEIYYHWLWNFPLSNSKPRVLSNTVDFPCCLQWDYFISSHAYFISAVHEWSSRCYRWQLQIKRDTFQRLQRAVD